MWDYTDKVKEHFLNPRNVGTIENADAEGEVGSLACGDALKLQLKIGEDGRIIDAKFQTFGCGSAIASSSALTEMIKGLTLDEAMKITDQQIADFLGGLPDEKMHCSVMGKEALEAAIKSYRGEKVDKHDHAEGEVVCKCFGVTAEKIKKAVMENKLKSIEEVTHFTKAGGGCQSCHGRIKELIDKSWVELESVALPSKSEKKLTNIQKINLIQETIEREIRPVLQADQGDIELVDVDGNTVLVALRGHCSGCQSSTITLKGFVEKKLREHVSDELVVQEVK